MATVTPNFNWPVPTSTDLVRDGATAIEALGDSIDASLVDLKGGTTGQVLSKTSGTDMDFTWVTTDDANAIQNSIVDAKGDLIAASANDTPARLAVGNNGETLVADSSTSTGLRWQGSYAAAKNILINGNADFWQRGTTTAAVANGAYLADRWKTVLSGTSLNATYSRDTSVPNGASKYSIKLQQLSSSASSVSEFAFRQSIEAASVYQLIGNQATVSFWYRSNQTGSHYLRIGASLLTGGTDTTQSFTVNAADTWEKKSLTFASFASVTAANLADNAEGAIIDIGIRTFGSGGTETVAANDYFQVTQIMLEAGSVATQFSRAGGTIQGELAACQRYAFSPNYNPAGKALNNTISSGYASSTTAARITLQLPVAMRTQPSSTITFTGGYVLDNIASVPAITALSVNQSGTTTVLINATVASGLTSGQPVTLYSGSASDTLIIQAEL
jgi:hypothetical protein